MTPKKILQIGPAVFSGQPAQCTHTDKIILYNKTSGCPRISAVQSKLNPGQNAREQNFRKWKTEQNA